MSEIVHILAAPSDHTLEELARLAATPLRAAGAERAIVFGSFARGTADGFSDLDLAVVLDTELPRHERARLLGCLLDALPLDVDLLVYTPEEFAEGTRDGYGIFDAIAREGVTIHARSEG